MKCLQGFDRKGLSPDFWHGQSSTNTLTTLRQQNSQDAQLNMVQNTTITDAVYKKKDF